MAEIFWYSFQIKSARSLSHIKYVGDHRCAVQWKLMWGHYSYHMEAPDTQYVHGYVYAQEHERRMDDLKNLKIPVNLQGR